jgi:hypothetical protein
MRKSDNHKILKSILGEINLKAVLFVILFTISVSWISDSLEKLLYIWYPSKTLIIAWIMLIGSSIILWGLYCLAVKSKSKNYEDATSIQKVEFKACEVLIIFLSNKNPKTHPKNTREIKNIEGFKDSNLYMPLNAIDKHKEKLRYLHVICSEQSYEMYEEDFKVIVNNLFPNIQMQNYKENIDFEDLESVQNALENVYEQAMKMTKNKEKEIIIDVTGGQKIVSIAGSYYCLANDRRFQYISTTSPTRVIQYNNRRVD